LHPIGSQGALTQGAITAMLPLPTTTWPESIRVFTAPTACGVDENPHNNY